MFFLASCGYRCIAHDRRGHGRSSQLWNGNHDQIVPIGAWAMLSSKLVKGSTLKVYPGLPHAMCSTHKDQINKDLLAFIKG